MPFPPPGDLPDPGVEPTSPALQVDSLPLSHLEARVYIPSFFFFLIIEFNLGGSVVKNPPAMQEMWAQSLGWKDPLDKEMATHSSILTWRVPWTEEPGRLQFMGSQRGRHD